MSLLGSTSPPLIHLTLLVVYQVDVFELYFCSFALQADGSGGSGCLGGYVLEDVVDENFDGVLPADDFAGVPLAGRVF